MKFIVGIDRRFRSQGAISFALWLRAELNTEVQLHGVHVLEEAELTAMTHDRPAKAVREEVEAIVWSALYSEGASEHMTSEIVQAPTAEQFLAQAVERSDADGIIIGRSAHRDSRSVMRLGRVARRLCRALPRMVIVVPPDLETSRLGGGPIVCAADATPQTLAAAQSATRFAALTGRRAVLLHALQIPQHVMYGESIRRERREAEARLAEFCRDNGLGEDVEYEVEVGAPERVVLARGEQLRSPMVLCGSRRLGLGQRLFNSSLATALARHSRVPVAIAPPA